VTLASGMLAWIRRSISFAAIAMAILAANPTGV
jgi:uncharacterized membrane protein YidH (DUF202 family)